MKRVFLSIFFSLLLCFSALAAVVHDNNSVETPAGVSAFNFTEVIIGTDPAIICWVSSYNGYSDVTDIKADTVSLPFLGESFVGGSYVNSARGDKITVGSKTIDVTLAGTSNPIAGCMGFSGVDQTTPYGTVLTATSVATAISLGITVPTNGVGAEVTYTSGDTPLTRGGGQTFQFDAITSGGGNQLTGSTMAASTTMTYDNPDGAYQMMIAIPINPAVAAAAIARRRIINAP